MFDNEKNDNIHRIAIGIKSDFHLSLRQSPRSHGRVQKQNFPAFFHY